MKIFNMKFGMFCGFSEAIGDASTAGGCSREYFLILWEIRIAQDLRDVMEIKQFIFLIGLGNCILIGS